MEEADGHPGGHAVYYAGINGTLKCFLDRAFYSRGSKMRHKVGAGLAAVRRTGGMTALADIEHFFTISEMLIPASNYWNVIHGRAKGEAQQDVEGLWSHGDFGPQHGLAAGHAAAGAGHSARIPEKAGDELHPLTV